MHRRTLSKDQQGAVSLITVIFVTILLTVLTTSFIRLGVNEQRQAIDDDLTTRAFYAAESGVQDAMRAINERLDPADANFAECTPAHGVGSGMLSAELDAEYTCQIINLTPPDYRAYLDKNESTFFKLEGTENITDFTVYWHIFGDDNDSDGTTYSLRANADLLTEFAWNTGNHPAMIRVQVMSIPESGSVQRGDINNSIAFFSPTRTGLPSVNLSTGVDGEVLNSNCTPATGGIDFGEYVCSATVAGLDSASRDYYLRIKALYRDTHIKVVANEGHVGLVGAQAVVDVTGRAADVFRRVQQRVNLTNDVLWPEFALFSAQDICKDFSITHPDADAAFALINGQIVGSCATPN